VLVSNDEEILSERILDLV